MATHSSIPAWKIPQTEESDSLTVHGITKRRTQLSAHIHTLTHRPSRVVLITVIFLNSSEISLLYLKWITNKVLQYSTGNSAPCYVTAWMGGERGQ